MLPAVDARRLRLAIRWIWLLGGVAFLLAAFRGHFFRPHLLGSRSANWVSPGFRADGIVPWTSTGALPSGVPTVGSWVGGDAWQGTSETPWIPAPLGEVRVCVAGYPQVPGCSLEVEYRHRDGSASRVPCRLPNPRESWAAWDFYVPSYGNPATAFRLVASDRTGVTTGWVAFSQPFIPASAFARSLYEGAQVITTLALVLTLVWLPGILLASRARPPALRAAALIGAGPLLLAAFGVALWIASARIAPATTGPLLMILGWAILGSRIWRRSFQPAIGPATQRALAIAVLCTVAATAKSTYSSGPEGELFYGSVARTLAVGNRSDARTSFLTSQVIQRHLSPTSAETIKYFTPWTFFSRGPLAGLAAAPVVFASGGRPPVEDADRIGWEPFDPTGYAAYRIALIALAALVIVAFFAVLAEIVDDGWALLGAGVLALCPFVTHELSFTWPKLAATAWLLVSFLLAHRGRPLLGGLALGIGYLFHPLALLWTPWVALWSAGRGDNPPGSAPHAARTRSPLLGAAGRLALFVAGAALIVGPWMAAGFWLPHPATATLAGQGNFAQYFLRADGLPATVPSWLLARWLNFSNTFLPFWLNVVNHYHTDINSVYHPAGALVKFAFSWWTTLPLGLGLLAWGGAVIALVRATRPVRPALLLLVVGPALLLIVYWGGAASGLMRECGHPILVAVVGVAIASIVHTPGRLAALAAHPAFPWLQLAGTWLMLWLTTLANPHPPDVELKLLDPVWFALNLGALATAAWLASSARAEFPCRPREHLILVSGSRSPSVVSG